MEKPRILGKLLAQDISEEQLRFVGGSHSGRNHPREDVYGSCDGEVTSFSGGVDCQGKPGIDRPTY
jgi:hypothetical protein